MILSIHAKICPWSGYWQWRIKLYVKVDIWTSIWDFGTYPIIFGRKFKIPKFWTLEIQILKLAAYKNE